MKFKPVNKQCVETFKTNIVIKEEKSKQKHIRKWIYSVH